MTKELKPCPACGCIAPRMKNLSPYKLSPPVGVWCPDCLMEVCRWTDGDEAVRVWNALPRRLRWTKEPPKDPGWYWWRPDKWNDAQIVFVDRWIFCKTHRLGFSAKFLKNWKEGHDVAALDGEWAGPIQEPEE